MSEKIVVTTLGESVTEATVAKWLKNKGDKVSSDEPIVELETDKVNVEVPSPSNGVLDSISVKEGETVNVGALLGLISKSKSTSISTESDSGEKKYSPPQFAFTWDHCSFGNLAGYNKLLVLYEIPVKTFNQLEPIV